MLRFISNFLFPPAHETASVGEISPFRVQIVFDRADTQSAQVKVTSARNFADEGTRFNFRAMDYSQIKTALLLFLALRLILDATNSLLEVILVPDEKELEVLERCDELIAPHGVVWLLSAWFNKAIALCVMIMFSTNWNGTPLQMLMVAIATFYDEIIGLAVWSACRL